MTDARGQYCFNPRASVYLLGNCPPGGQSFADDTSDVETAWLTTEGLRSLINATIKPYL